MLLYIKLDGQGRARREAARRRKSEWEVNVAIPNSFRSNGSWQVTPARKLCYRKDDRAMPQKIFDFSGL